MRDAAGPIGVFDSGLGGLTVYRALRNLLPHENFIYLGDTANLPYGTKSAAHVTQLTLEAARALYAYRIKYLVVACNTVSAQALDALQQTLPDLPYCGVIAAGAEAAIRMTRNDHVAILATEGTVRSGVYPEVLRALNKKIDVQMLGCNLLVSLVEEGWFEGKEAEALVARYLSLLTPGYDTLVLGCTHFPMLLPIFRALCAKNVTIVDTAEMTAHAVAGYLAARDYQNSQKGEGSECFFATDAPDRFARIASLFLRRTVAADTLK